MELKDSLKESFSIAQRTLENFLAQDSELEKVAQISQDLASAFTNNKKVLICGNGGSACDAMHFAEEFTGKFRSERRALPVISLTDSSHITCVGNDYGFEAIFSRGVEAFGLEGDYLVVLSTSGNSPNIIRAVAAAKEKNMKTIALLGKTGGKLAGSCDIEFIIPGTTSDRIQELHMTVLHIIIEGVERILFPENY